MARNKVMRTKVDDNESGNTFDRDEAIEDGKAYARLKFKQAPKPMKSFEREPFVPGELDTEVEVRDFLYLKRKSIYKLRLTDTETSETYVQLYHPGDFQQAEVWAFLAAMFDVPFEEVEVDQLDQALEYPYDEEPIKLKLRTYTKRNGFVGLDWTA